MPKKVKFYKEPVFLFTSGSLRFAAWAGWYSALGDAEQSERWAHQARAEWMKEVGAGRRFALLGRHNHDMYNYISPEPFPHFFKSIFANPQAEIRKGKKTSNR